MATPTKFEQFAEDLGKQVHNLSSDSLKILLTNTAPDPATDAVKGDLSEITAEHGYSAGGTALANKTFEQVDGTAFLIADDVVFTASGGPVGPFRYAVLYNDTPTSPADPLIQFWDYGSSITLQSGETFTVDLSPVNGALQVA